MSPSTPPEIYKDLILNLRTPHVFKNIAFNWKCFTQDLRTWIANFDEAQSSSRPDGIAFDCASMYNGRTPQWECTRSTRQMTATEFLDTFQNATAEKCEQWASFSYRDLTELPPKCRDGVSMAALGFADLADFSFWLGSAGSHTPCHYDTYGCNVIVQVFGRKSWLLFPPTANLTPTRIPYEESSVYCAENFFSPSSNSPAAFQRVKQDAHHVVLEAGDVLLVPPMWWHYVESIDVSLAINTWIPLNRDLDAQIKECLIKTNVSEYTRCLPQDLQRLLINPNELTSLYSTPLVDNLKLLNLLKRLKRNHTLRNETLSTHCSNYLDDTSVAKLLSSHRDQVLAVPNISSAQFQAIIASKLWRFRESVDSGDAVVESTAEYKMLSEFINTMCRGLVVDEVSDSIYNDDVLE